MNMLDPVITMAFVWIQIGSLVWVFAPVSHTDFALSRYCARNGRLPPAGFWVAAIVGAILAWPKVVAVIVQAKRERLRKPRS